MREIILMLVVAILSGCYPTKVIDPSDPRFDPMKFDFNDYKRHEEMAEVLGKMFNAGMSRDKIEKILVDVGGANPKDRSNNNDFGYTLDNDKSFQSLLRRADRLILYKKGGKTSKFSGWFVYVFYDKDSKAMAMYEWNAPIFDSSEQQGAKE